MFFATVKSLSTQKACIIPFPWSSWRLKQLNLSTLIVGLHDTVFFAKSYLNKSEISSIEVILSFVIQKSFPSFTEHFSNELNKSILS